MRTTDTTFDAWRRLTFDRPVTDPAWYWENDEDAWNGPASASLDYLTRTFENAATILAPFSDAQLNQAFWYLVGDAGGAGGEIRAVFDLTLPREDRVRCLRAIYTLFAQCFLPRCPVHVPGGDTRATPLASAVYMWWDLFPSEGAAQMSARHLRQYLSPESLALLPTLPTLSEQEALEEDKAMDSEVLEVMRRILTLPSDTCRESALHGLGHWERCYPVQVHTIIDGFLADCPTLSPELRAYALLARRGRVQ